MKRPDVDILIPIPSGIPFNEQLLCVAAMLKQRAEKAGCPLYDPRFTCRLIRFFPETRSLAYRIQPANL